MLHHDDGSWENPVFVEVDDDTSLPAKIFERAQERPGEVVAERRAGVGNWQEVTAAEFAADVTSLASGMHALGIRGGSHVGILAATSYEWAALDLAVLSLGAITVPIYESDSAMQIKHILADAKMNMVITQSLQQAELVRKIRQKTVKHVYSLDQDAVRTLRRAGSDVPDQVILDSVAKINLNDVATIIYTSGTTGVPKGVILTHGNFVRPLMQAFDLLPAVIDTETSRTLLFLPVAHVLARFVMHGILMGRGRLGFCPDTRTLLQDIETFRPTTLLSVPRVLEKVYNSASAKAGKGFRSKVFSWSALQAKKMSETTAFPQSAADAKKAEEDESAEFSGKSLTSPGPSLGLQVTHRVADTLVLRKIRKILGSDLDTVICGGAPLSDDLAHFFRGMGAGLLQGYGLSETTGPITVQIPGDNPPGSVGYLWPGNSMKLADDGELLLKGISVTPGYHNLSRATDEAFTDGWFHTGDLARIDEDGRLYITGRKKELIVTAGGKNVSPEVLEHHLVTHPLIGQVIAVGDGRPYVGALISLDPEMLPTWLTNKGLTVVPPYRAASMHEVKDSIERAIARANSRVSRAESIRRYRIIDADFTVDNGYLTPSLKLKRHRVMRDFAEDIDLLYDLTPAQLAGVGGTVQAPAVDEKSN